LALKGVYGALSLIALASILACVKTSCCIGGFAVFMFSFRSLHTCFTDFDFFSPSSERERYQSPKLLILEDWSENIVDRVKG